MNLNDLRDTPPWDWPETAAKRIHQVLVDRGAQASERLLAADLAGDITVINDDLAGALLGIVRGANEPEPLRAQAAISLGPVLEYADTDGFEDLDDLTISERTFHTIQNSLHELYQDESLPKEVRRRILEASVRAPLDWHAGAIRTAYSSGDREWVITAVFSMRWVRGFDDVILEAMNSPQLEVQAEAITAAGNWELEPAWPRVVALVTDPATPKPLLLAAIGAVAGIRPEEAPELLVDLADSEDEEIADAADEALSMAEELPGEDEEYEEDEDEDEEEEETE
jgi:hypothetical protein